MNAARRLVLVIDDDEMDRERVVRWLGQRFAVCQASTARTGIDMLRTIQPSCVLLDYRLTDGDGLELLADVCQAGAQAILMTGVGDERVAAESIKRGAFEYLAKDGTTQERLATVVEKAIQQAGTRMRLVQTENELGALFAAAAEEIKPTLRAARASCSQALARLDDDAARDDVETAENELGILETYFENLLRYVGVDDNSDRESLDLREVVGEAAELAELPAGIRTHFADLPIIEGNRGALLLMFEAILRNAAEQGGDSLTKIAVFSSYGTGEWTISIEDDGRGVDEWAAVTGLPGLRDSRGWGLATARRVAQRHGGSLEVENIEGVGSTVRIRLPAS